MNRIKHTITSELDIHFMKSEMAQLSDSYSLSENLRMKLYTIISELAHNQIKYAKKGSIEVSFFKEAARQGIKIKATDKGPGIQDIELALKDSYSTRGTLGI